MSEQTTQPSGKVRVYQTQSRLIGLHASCALALRSFIGSISPRFNVNNTGQSAQAVRLRDCELCAFRSLGNPQLVAHYKVLNSSLRPIQSAEDRMLTKGQLEVINFVRQERLAAAHTDIARDEERRAIQPAIESGQFRQRVRAAPVGDRSLEGWANIILKPKAAHEFPPARVVPKNIPQAKTRLTHKPNPNALAEASAAFAKVDLTPGHVKRYREAVQSADLDEAFACIEEGQRAKRKPVAQQPRPGESLHDTDSTVALAVEGMNEARTASGIGPVEAEAVPARVAVSWLKDKVRQYRGKLATVGLNVAEQAHLDAYRVALAERGWTEG